MASVLAGVDKRAPIAIDGGLFIAIFCAIPAFTRYFANPIKLGSVWKGRSRSIWVGFRNPAFVKLLQE